MEGRGGSDETETSMQKVRAKDNDGGREHSTKRLRNRAIGTEAVLRVVERERDRKGSMEHRRLRVRNGAVERDSEASSKPA